MIRSFVFHSIRRLHPKTTNIKMSINFQKDTSLSLFLIASVLSHASVIRAGDTEVKFIGDYFRARTVSQIVAFGCWDTYGKFQSKNVKRNAVYTVVVHAKVTAVILRLLLLLLLLSHPSADKTLALYK